MDQEEYCDGCGRGCLLSNPMCQLGMNIARERGLQTEEDPAGSGEEARSFERAGNRRGGGEQGNPHGHGGGESHGHGAAGQHGRGGSHGGRGFRGHGGPGAGGRGTHGHGGPDGRGHGRPGGRGRGPRPGEVGDAASDQMLVRRFHHCAHLLMHRRAKEGGRAGVLMVLSHHGFMAQSMLAEKLDIRSASLSELLGKMEQAGLVTRSQNERDKRSVWVELTDEGRAEAERVAAQREEDNKNLFAALTEEEKHQLDDILGKLTHSWHEQFDDEGHRGGHGGPRGAREVLEGEKRE